jgi:hypothetical protein
MVDKQAVGKLQHSLGIIVKGTTGLTILLGLGLVIPLTLWFTWVRRSAIANSIAVSLFCLSFAWLLMSLFQLNRTLGKLGLGPEGRTRLFSGPRPDDPDELRAWRCGWQFLYAVLAVLLCMIAIPVASWLAAR